MRCRLCPHDCAVGDGERGKCLVRQNLGGVLYSTSYEECTGVRVAPIESVPLYHFHPGARVLELSAAGENLPPPDPATYDPAESRWASAKELVELALARGVQGIAFTGAEPLLWVEFVREVARAGREAGLWNVLATRGFVHAAPLGDLIPALSGAVIQLEGTSDAPYAPLAGAAGPVLRAAKALRDACPLEIAFRVRPGQNDGEALLDAMALWIASHLGAATPVHVFAVGREPAAPAAISPTLRAFEALRARLPHVYLDDVARIDSNDTRCAACKEPLVLRPAGHPHRPVGLTPDGRCLRCGAAAGFVR